MCNKKLTGEIEYHNKTRKLDKTMTKKSMRTTHIYTSRDAGSY